MEINLQYAIILLEVKRLDNVSQLIAKVIEGTSINTLVTNAWVKKYPADFKYGPHSHLTIELNYIKSGSCNMKIGDDYVHFNENDCMILYPGIEHYFFVDKHRSCTLVQLDFNVANFNQLNIPGNIEDQLVFLYDIKTNSRKYIKLYDTQNISICMQRISEELETLSENYETLINLYFSELFILLSRQIKKTLHGINVDLNEYVRKALQYINENFTEELNVDEIAHKCSISTRHLLHMFKLQTNMTIIDYINSARISRAKELMKDPNSNLTTIAMECGFNNLQYFCRVFKKYTDLTPGKFREML